MPTLTYPGVYIEELPSSVHTITGVATSIAAFVGWAPKGSTTQATLVQSPSDYQRLFGGLDARSLLGYSVMQFFQNGGQQAYIVRLISQDNTGAAAKGSAVVNAGAGGGKLTFTAASAGSWSNSYGIQISTGTAVKSFKISVVYAPAGVPPVVLESFDNLLPANWATLAIASAYVTMATAGTATAVPANGVTMLAGGTDKNQALLATVTVNGPKGGANGVVFSAANEGAWGNSIAVAATPQPGDITGTRFSLFVFTVDNNGNLVVVESYNNLSITSTDALYVVTVINNDSNYLQAATTATAPTKALDTGYPTTNPIFLTGGVDGTVLDPTAGDGKFITALNLAGAITGGIPLLDRVDIFNLLCVPGETDGPTISALQQYCNTKRAFYIVDTFQTATASGLATTGPVGSTPGTITGQFSINSAYYFPWVNAPDPLVGNRPRLFPPCGFVAGIYAQTDNTRGVWKAPAGIDASLTGEVSLQTNLTDLENGNLNTQGINCLRHFKVYGDVVWGARTLQGADAAGSQWKYVPIRRLALFLESSLFQGTQWVVFEPNDETLWGQIRLNVGAFMQTYFLKGAFQGTTPQQAYFVKCDAENNPQSSIDQGIVNILVGFAPLFPAEFVVIQIQQMAGQLGP